MSGDLSQLPAAITVGLFLVAIGLLSIGVGLREIANAMRDGERIVRVPPSTQPWYQEQV